jgi:phosphate transport system permease protein
LWGFHLSDLEKTEDLSEPVEVTQNAQKELIRFTPPPMKERSWLVFVIPAGIVIVINILIFGYLLYRAGLFFGEYPIWEYFFGTVWNVAYQEFGYLPMVYGTFVVILIALVIGVPLAFSVSIFMAEIAPGRIRSSIKVIVELLAGIPSIVWALIGIWYVVPLVAKMTGQNSGWNGISGGIILAIMILPTIVTLSDDALRGVPNDQKEAAYALGSTHWQVIHKVSVPIASPGIFSAIILGLARAFGETIVVLIICGNTPNIPALFFNFTVPIRTMTANLVAEMGDTQIGSIAYNALLAGGLVLFIISFVINYLGSRMQRRMMKKYSAFRANA